MSIIERALILQRATAAKGAPARKEADSSATTGTTSRSEPSREPKRVLALEMDQLERSGLLPPEELRARQTHEYRAIKRALLDAPAQSAADKSGAAANLIMVTSALAREGKTYTSFSLARSLALELDRPTVLVDADIPKRDLSRALGAEDAPGLLDMLGDEQLAPEDVLIPTSLGFQFLPVGAADERANELISSRRMAHIVTLLGSLKGRSTVVFDSPPMLLTSEAASLARLVGQIVVVVRAAVTPQDAVRDVISRLDPSKRISAVLNGWTPTGALERQYQLGYYYGESGAGREKAK